MADLSSPSANLIPRSLLSPRAIRAHLTLAHGGAVGGGVCRLRRGAGESDGAGVADGARVAGLPLPRPAADPAVRDPLLGPAPLIRWCPPPPPPSLLLGPRLPHPPHRRAPAAAASAASGPFG